MPGCSVIPHGRAAWRDPEVCASCRTKDCIRGRPEARGCELSLFLPRKSSNMDCTLCLDCVHACPHDNIGIVSGTYSSIFNAAPLLVVWRKLQPLR